MSNYHAIATVTATIGQILEDVKKDVTGVVITLKPLDTLGKTLNDGLNIFLYQVTLSKEYKNLDLPIRDRAGELIHQEELALNLHYLLTAYSATNDELRAQQILTSA